MQILVLFDLALQNQCFGYLLTKVQKICDNSPQVLQENLHTKQSFARLLLKGMQEWPMTMWTGRVKTIIDGILRPTMPFVGQAEGKRRLRTLSFCAV